MTYDKRLYLCFNLCWGGGNKVKKLIEDRNGKISIFDEKYTFFQGNKVKVSFIHDNVLIFPGFPGTQQP